MLRRIRNIVITGIVVLLPLITSTYIIWFLFKVIDNVTGFLVELIIGRQIPGIGLVFTFLIIFLVGLFATNIIGKKIISFGENILLRIPLFRNIYISIKKVLDALFTQHRSSFQKAVLFEYPRPGLYQLGFLTGESSPYFEQKTGRELYNIFLPTTPNPTSGMFIMVPRSEAIILDIPIEDALRLIISGGILNPETLRSVEENEGRKKNDD